MSEKQAKAGQRRECPKCQGVAINVTPLKVHNERAAIFACQTKGCGYAFQFDGEAYLNGPEDLSGWFKGVIGANEGLSEILGTKTMNPATRNLILARMVDYGMQMFSDGLKQGLLINTHYRRRIPPHQIFLPYRS